MKQFFCHLTARKYSSRVGIPPFQLHFESTLDRWKQRQQKYSVKVVLPLPAESLKKKYGSEALLGHATRYHGDVNLKILS